jgi:hypothetical protein
MKTKLFYYYIFFLLTILSACSTDVPRKKVIVLIDYSGSVKESEFRKYEEHIVKIFMSLQPNDCFTVYPIDKGSTYKNSVLYSLDEKALSEENFSRPGDGVFVEDSVRKRMLAVLNNEKAILERSLESNFGYRVTQEKLGKQTDLLGAFEKLNEALLLDEKKSWFEDLQDLRDDFKTTNYVVVFSDMINDTKEYNFNDWTTEGEHAVVQTLDELYQKQQLKDNLDKVNVFIYGPTVDENTVMYRNIDFFWHEYFKRRKAEVLQYTFDDPTMKGFFDHNKTL